MEIKKEELIDLMQSFYLLAKGQQYKSKFIEKPKITLLDPYHKSILHGYPKALEILKLYGGSVGISGIIDEYQEVLKIFEKTFPQLYEKDKDITQTFDPNKTIIKKPK